MSTNTKVGSVLKTYCSSCQGQRNCEVKGHHVERGDDGYYQWRTDWYLLSCRGCEHAFAQTVSTNSEDVDYDYDHEGNTTVEAVERKETWPARSKRKLPDWFNHFYIETDLENTGPLADALRELYGALEADLSVLASIGIRTSFDIASELLGVNPILGFDKKIDQLVTDGHILDAEKEGISILVNVGSASAHRGWKPQASDIDPLMTGLEEFIYNSIVFPARKRAQAAKLADINSRVPKRVKKDSSTKPSKTEEPSK